jgi:hypothetical protein
MNRQLILLLVIVCACLFLAACETDRVSDNERLSTQIAGTNVASEQSYSPTLTAMALISHATQTAVAFGPVPSGDSTGEEFPQPERLIIKNGDMSLLVEDIDVTLDAITGIAAQYGGYVLRTSANRTGVNSATITIAVEAAYFENAIQSIRGTGLEVLSESTSGEDVTAEYVDLDSRMRNLEATRDRLRGFLDESQNVEEALDVNTELSRIEGEIEQVKGRMNYLTGRAAFSTITITLREKLPPTPTPTPEPGQSWSPGETIDGAIEAQQDAVHFLVDLVIWLVVFAGPYLLILGLAVWGWWRWLRRPNRTSE